MSTAWRDVKGLMVNPREGLEEICARQTVGWSVALGVVAYYWRMLPLSEVVLGPIGGPVTYLTVNCLVALGWMGLITVLIHLATRLLGHCNGRWRDMLLLWGYAQVPGIVLIVLGVVFSVTAPLGWRHELGIAWFAPAAAIAGLLFFWRLLLQFHALRICYGLSGWRLLAVIVLALTLYNLALWVEFTFVDDRGRVPGAALRAMSPTLCPLMASRTYVSLPFDRLTYRVRTPRRGEIAGFVPSGWTDSPASVLLRARVRFLGRVVGVPEDEVEVRQGQLYLNGQPHGEPYRGRRPGIDVGATRLRAGEYFVVGDNRDIPLAEYHGGIVTRQDLRGRLTAAGQWKWAVLVDASRC